MKRVLVAYDVSMLRNKEAKLTFLKQLCELHKVSYSWPESNGDIENAKTMFIAEYTNIDGTIVTNALSFSRSDFRDWWDYRGPILPAVIGLVTLGSL